jgi:hypothetical protein
MPDISILEGDRLRQIVAVLQDPALQDDNLTYTVKVVQGDMPATGSDVSVFIDIIGMPMTPMSFAGVARRHYGGRSTGDVREEFGQAGSDLTHNAPNHGRRS